MRLWVPWAPVASGWTSGGVGVSPGGGVTLQWFIGQHKVCISSGGSARTAAGVSGTHVIQEETLGR